MEAGRAWPATAGPRARPRAQATSPRHHPLVGQSRSKTHFVGRGPHPPQEGLAWRLASAGRLLRAPRVGVGYGSAARALQVPAADAPGRRDGKRPGRRGGVLSEQARPDGPGLDTVPAAHCGAAQMARRCAGITPSDMNVPCDSNLAIVAEVIEGSPPRSRMRSAFQAASCLPSDVRRSSTREPRVRNVVLSA